MNRPRILVVDDKLNMRKLLATVLGEKYEITCAEDGAQALALLTSREFDVLLTDVRMPGADGLEILKAVRHLGLLTEVVLMTGGSTLHDAVAGVAPGAFACLQKPFDPDVAALAVGRAVEQKLRRLRALEQD